ncbi:MAG: hypothetical protein ACOYLB_11610 [Phototrophicaceae bacterium]
MFYKQFIKQYAIALLSLSTLTIALAQDAEVVIEKSGFFPESVAIADGVLYTSNFASGEVLAINMEDGSSSVLAEAQEGKAGWGLYVDESTGVLFSCVAGLGEPFGGVAPTTPNDVNVYSLETSELLENWQLESGIVCNSITIGGDNTVFISDIVTPQIIKLDTETGEATVWSKEDDYAVEGGFGISGLVWDGASSLYAVANGSLFRVDINADGSAAPAVKIALMDADGETEALATDGLVWVADGVMVGTENDVFAPGANGRALRITLLEDDSAVVDTIAQGLSDPSAITAVTDKEGQQLIYVANSQMGYLFGVDQGEAPNATFSVVNLSE